MGYFYPNGLSSKSGAHPLLTKPIYLSNKPVFVDSVNGNASYQGTYTRPKASIKQSLSSGDVVIAKEGHAETFASAMTMASNVTLIGETISAGVPQQSLTSSQASGNMFTISTNTSIHLVNLKFPVRTVSNTDERIIDGGSSAGNAVIDCYFEDDSNGQYPVWCGAPYNQYLRNTHVSVGTAFGSVSEVLLNVGSAADHARVEACTFDNGAYGVTDVALNADAATTGMRVYGVTMVRGAEGEVSTPGIFYAGTVSGAGSFSNTGAVMDLHRLGQSSANTDPLLTEPVFVSGDVFYVDSATGSDSNAGTPEAPFATLAYAVTQLASACSVIVLLSGHAETLTAAATISQVGTLVIAEPSVTLTINGTSAALTASSAGCEFRNVQFTSGSAMSSGSMLSIAADGCVVEGCKFTGDTAGTMLSVSTASHTIVSNCSLTSASGVGDGTPAGLVGPSGTHVITLRDCSFDGGTHGFNGFALNLGNASGTVRAESVTLTNGADAKIHASSVGYLQLSWDSTGHVEAF